MGRGFWSPEQNVNVDSGLKALEVPRLDRATEVLPQAVVSEDEIAFWGGLEKQAEDFFSSEPLEEEFHSLSSEEDVLYWNNVIRNLYESHSEPLLLCLQVREDNTR